ncbi:MAG: hypothetical protein P4L75_01175, partial [Clostridia bacterium]|nr:hypothetical protein [Clostridia bacterium]
MGKIFKKDGYALLWVLCIFTFAVLLSGGLITATVVASKTATQQLETQQAYFTARSAVLTTVAFIQKNAGDTTTLSNLIGNTGTGTSTSMGDYSVTVATDPKSANRLTVTATAKYKNQSSTVAAHILKTTTTSSSNIIPINYLFCTGNGTNTFKPFWVTGDVYVNGPITFSGSSGSATVLYGNLIANGNVTIQGYAWSADNVFCSGNLDMEDYTRIEGDVLAKGNVLINNDYDLVDWLDITSIDGNVQCDGYLKISGGGVGQYWNNYTTTVGGRDTNGYSVICTGGAQMISNSTKLLYVGNISASSSNIPGTKTKIATY